MKIQLERKRIARLVGGEPSPLENRLECVSCQHSFGSSKLGTLLCHDDGSIVGDICMGCLKQGASHIKHQLKRRSIGLYHQPQGTESLLVYRRALELSELATQPLTIPPVYIFWWQQLVIFVAETQELEQERRQPKNYRHRQPKPLKPTFLTDKKSGDLDD